MINPDRRLLLAALSASMLPPGTLAALAAPSGNRPAVRLGPPKDFSFAALTARAKKNAGQPYQAPQPRASHLIKDIDFDAVQKIRFRPDHALWAGGPEPDPISFFHLNKYSADPVLLRALEG